jgi:hypothetical protein
VSCAVAACGPVENGHRAAPAARRRARFVRAGSQYAGADVDADGNFFDGAKQYRLRLPAGVPAKNFWSICVYDTQTRSELQTGQPFPSLNNMRDPLHANADGSFDIVFGPDEPAELATNWIQTVPGKGWFVVLRLYGPLDAWFDQTWRPGDVELHDEITRSG